MNPGSARKISTGTLTETEGNFGLFDLGLEILKITGNSAGGRGNIPGGLTISSLAARPSARKKK